MQTDKSLNERLDLVLDSR